MCSEVDSCADGLERGAVRFDRVYKAYPRDISGWGALKRLVELFRPPRLLEQVSESDLRRPDLVWALRDVSFCLSPGEVLGVIGPNGSGKSSLLRLVAGITLPTSGRVYVNGRVGSLLEVGAGLHPEMTGRENIYLNGRLLGLSTEEIEERFEDIVEFSGLREFLDMPVKRYSTGMYVRLGFSVATAVAPDVLLIDEVLAVGDWAFQRKCMARLRELKEGGTTILFVSHNMDAVRQFCTRCLFLVDGAVLFDGEPEPAVQRYYAEGYRTWVVRGTGAPTTPRRPCGGQGVALDHAIEGRLLGADGEPRTTLTAGEPCTLEIVLDGERIQEEAGHVRVDLFDEEGTLLAGISTREDRVGLVRLDGRKTVVRVHFPSGLPVARGRCRFRVVFVDPNGMEPFAVEDRVAEVACVSPAPQTGPVYVPRKWEMAS